MEGTDWVYVLHLELLSFDVLLSLYVYHIMTYHTYVSTSKHYLVASFYQLPSLPTVYHPSIPFTPCAFKLVPSKMKGIWRGFLETLQYLEPAVTIHAYSFLIK